MSCANNLVNYGDQIYLYNPASQTWVGNGAQLVDYYDCKTVPRLAQPTSKIASQVEPFTLLNGQGSVGPGGPTLSSAGSAIGGNQAFGPVSLVNSSRANMTSKDKDGNSFVFNCSSGGACPFLKDQKGECDTAILEAWDGSQPNEQVFQMVSVGGGKAGTQFAAPNLGCPSPPSVLLTSMYHEGECFELDGGLLKRSGKCDTTNPNQVFQVFSSGGSVPIPLVPSNGPSGPSTGPSNAPSGTYDRQTSVLGIIGILAGGILGSALMALVFRKKSPTTK